MKKPKPKRTKVIRTFSIDKSTDEFLEIVAEKTQRSKSNVVDLILTRALPTFVKDPDLL